MRLNMKEKKLRTIIALSINLVILPLLIGMSFFQYYIAQKAIKQRYEELRAQTERSVFDAYRIVNKSYQVIAKIFDERLESAFRIFIDEYKKAKTIDQLDLELVKNKIGNDFDLYIIDERNVIVKTTYPTDLGLDFNTYSEMVAKLQAIRMSSVYVGDILVHETRSGKLRKFGYMASPDHKYVLELGLVSNLVSSLIDEYNPYSLLTTLKTINPGLMEIEVYKAEGTYEFYPEREVEPDVVKKVQQVYRDHKPIIEIDPKTMTITKYLYQYIENPDNPTQVRRIIKLVYSFKDEKNTLKAISISLTVVLFLVAIMVVLTSFQVAKLVSKPIEKASHSLRQLADGHYNIPRSTILPVYEMNLVLHDIQKLADALTKMRNQAEEASKIKAQFLSSVTHELRTPLNAIINFSILTSLDPCVAANPETTSMLLKIEQSGRHLLKLIDDILDFEKGCTGTMKFNLEAVNLEAMVPGIVASLPEMIGDKQVEIRTNIQNWIPPVIADRKALRRVFLDIIRNAAKFTNQGYISIDISNYNERELLVTITDTGIGMTEEEVKKVFDEFYTVDSGLDKVQHGLGLGLSICKQIIKALDGDIWIESKLNEGTSIFFTLKKAK